METTGQGPHDQSIFVSWVSSGCTVTYRPKNSLARMTTAHFLPFFGLSFSPTSHPDPHLPLRRFVLRPPASASNGFFDILLLTGALLYGPALLVVVDYLFHSRKQAKGTGSRDARSRSVRLINGKKTTDMPVVLSIIINNER